MGQVVQLHAAANDDDKPQQSLAVQVGIFYECQRCGAGHFHLFADGHIVCADCSAVMNNLKTLFTKGDSDGPRTISA